MRTPLTRIRLGGFVLFSVFAVAVVGYRWFGGYDWIGAIYMVVITISTVGYGETSSLTPLQKLFTVSVILVGISASVYTFGGLFQLMLEGELERVLGKRRMIKEIQNLSGHSIICGYGRMGQNLAHELREHGRKLVIIDHNSEKVAEATSNGFLCVLGDATEEGTLLDAGLDRASTLVSTFPNDAESVFITLTARNLNPKIKIISRAERESTQKKLRQAGADTIVMPTIVGARQMGRMITRPSTAHLINLVDEGTNRAFDLDELLIGPGSPLVGMTVEQTEAHRRHRLLVVAIKDSDGNLRFNPAADDQFAAGDIVMVVGHRDQIKNFRQEYRIAPA
jgi:voltage-gated potassium channel